MALQQGVALHLPSPSPPLATETVVMPSGASVSLPLPISYSGTVISGGEGRTSEAIKAETGKETNNSSSASLPGFLRG